MAIKHIANRIKNNKYVLAIIFASLIVRFLWLAALIERDEGVYGYIGMIWLRGYMPYADIPDNKGPFQYFLYATSNYFFGNTIIAIRIMNNIFFLASMVILYMVVRDWYGKGPGLSTTLFYGIFMNVPVLQAQQALTESTSVPFLIFSIYFCNQYLKRGQKIKLLLSGTLMSVALLIRQTQIAGFFVLLTMIALANNKSFEGSLPSRSFNIWKMLRDSLILVSGMLIPISVVISYFWTKGILTKMIECMLLRGYHSGYLSVPNVPFGMKFLILAEGLPLWLFGFLGCIICISRLNDYDKTLIIWTLSFLLVVLIPPNFGHHFIQIIAPTSILSGIILDLISREARNFSLTSRLRANIQINDNARNRLGVLMIVILVLTFLPSVFLQVIQYPNFNIEWEFIRWNYADSMSYSQQVELANYLKEYISENGSVLIHGWTATPYWLSGKTAPLVGYTATVRHPEIHVIPDEKFHALARDVDNGHFEYVVIFSGGSKDVQTLMYRLDDPIVYYTLRNYFYAKNIGNAQIFSRYDFLGRYIYHDFIANFSNALKEYELENGTVRNLEEDFKDEGAFIPQISELGINEDKRNTILQVPIPSAKSLIRYQSILIPPNSTLKFGIGLDPSVWYREGGDGVLFEIIMKDNQSLTKIFSKQINPKENPIERRWLDFEIDLNEYCNKKVDILFITSPGMTNDVFDDWAHWSDPKILSQGV